MSYPRDNDADDVSTLRVALGERSYDIVIGENLLHTAGVRMRPVMQQPRAIVVTDSRIAPMYLEPTVAALAKAGIDAAAVVMPAGEATKSFDHLRDLVDRLLDARVERSTCLVALGGGVIGDLVGFAASIVLRGLDFVQMPTTLLAQVDSSVGGKTGINSRHGKNLVGAFHQPRLVLADIGVLESLPHREFLSGYAETVKYGLLGDAAFFDWLEANGDALRAGDRSLRRQAVLTSCAAKADCVVEDERETGRRKLLNLGHTFAHAFEVQTGYGDRLRHGEAVGIGMVMAFDLSVRLGLCPSEDAERVRNHLTKAGLPVGLDGLADSAWTADVLLGHMAKDKKVRDGRLVFVLARGIGEAFVAEDVAVDDVRAVLDAALAG